MEDTSPQNLWSKLSDKSKVLKTRDTNMPSIKVLGKLNNNDSKQNFSKCQNNNISIEKSKIFKRSDWNIESNINNYDKNDIQSYYDKENVIIKDDKGMYARNNSSNVPKTESAIKQWGFKSKTNATKNWRFSNDVELLEKTIVNRESHLKLQSSDKKPTHNNHETITFRDTPKVVDKETNKNEHIPKDNHWKHHLKPKNYFSQQVSEAPVCNIKGDEVWINDNSSNAKQLSPQPHKSSYLPRIQRIKDKNK